LKVAAETLLTIVADVKRLGAKLGVTFVLHTWASALTHHPHVHGIVLGGGLSADGEHWVSCKSGFFSLPVCYQDCLDVCILKSWQRHINTTY
jgi:hypothetical protein